MNSKKKTAGIIAGVIFILGMIGLAWWIHKIINKEDSNLELNSAEGARIAPKVEKELLNCVQPITEEYVKEDIVVASWGDCDKCFYKNLRSQWFAISENGEIYILDTHYQKIIKYDSKGHYKNTINLNVGYKYLDDFIYVGLAINNNNDIYVLNEPYINVFDKNGKLLYNYIIQKETGTSEWQTIYSHILNDKSTVIVKYPPGYAREGWDPYRLLNFGNQIYLRVSTTEGSILLYKLNHKATLDRTTKYRYVPRNPKYLYGLGSSDGLSFVESYSVELNKIVSSFNLPECININNTKEHIKFWEIVEDDANNTYLRASIGANKIKSILIKTSLNGDIIMIKPEIMIMNQGATMENYDTEDQIILRPGQGIYKLEARDNSLKIVRWREK